MTYLILILIGLIGGAASGFVGIGGGVVVVPLLVLCLSIDQKMAQGTTLAMLAIPIAAFAAATYFRAGYVNLKFAALLAIGFVCGSLLSAHYAVKLSSPVATRLFGGVLLVVAAKLLIWG